MATGMDVTAPTTAAAASLNPAAKAFVPWWRLGGSWKPLAADAPEFVPAAAVGAGGNAAADPGILRTERVAPSVRAVWLCFAWWTSSCASSSLCSSFGIQWENHCHPSRKPKRPSRGLAISISGCSDKKSTHISDRAAPEECGGSSSLKDIKNTGKLSC